MEIAIFGNLSFYLGRQTPWTHAKVLLELTNHFDSFPQLFSDNQTALIASHSCFLGIKPL
ncbi:hypothetical protein [Flavobacterium sp. SM2513]|uniref:hypothetical protein n=1 Tax=Flavobacterium sp. SM2513 TaxID=3424766 RepID=UPI003D7F9EFC